MMKVAVTGRNGQLAQCLYALSQEPDVSAKLEFVFLSRPDFDLANSETVRQQIVDVAPDLIISAAAYTAVDLAEDEADAAYACNDKAVEAIALAAKETGASVLHLSTDYVYDGAAEAPYVETAATAPLGIYGKSKLAGEKALERVSAPYAIFRTAWVYSAFGKNFVKTMLALAETRDELGVVADQFGCPTSAHEIARILVDIALRWDALGDRLAGEIYHLCGTGEASWADLAEHVFAASEAMGGPTAKVNRITTEQFPTKATRPKNSRLNTDKLFNATGLRADRWQDSVDQVVRRLIEG